MPLTLKNDFPEVKYVTGIWQTLYENSKIKYKNNDYTGFTGASAEPDMFKIFEYKVILGDINSALKSPDNVVVSKSFASKIFNKENPIGKTITIDKLPFTISHVFNDLPNNSSVKFDILFSDKIREKISSEYKIAWWWGGMTTYVILHDNYSVEDFNQHLKKIPEKYYPDFLKGRSTYLSMPFSKMHYSTSILGSTQPAVSFTYLILLGSISFIILLIACVNYINLTLARAFKLNIDAGIRRISGAGPYQIIYLQVCYAFLYILTALIIAIPVSQFCLPLFEKLAERQIMGQINNINVWLVTISASIVVALISGFIPGKIFSKVNLSKIIKSKGVFIKTYNGIHNGLLIFQFSLTIALIISQLFIIKQISFMKNADLGFDNNNLISVNLSSIEAEYVEKYTKSKLYNAEIVKQGAQYGLSLGTITENVPGYYYQNGFTVNPVKGKVDECLVICTSVDENYSQVFKVDVVKGRFFSEKYSTDHQAFIINETAMKKFGWNDIDGKFLKLKHEEGDFPVIGVMKDINTGSLKEPISPMLYRFGQYNSFPAFLTFRIAPDHEVEAVAFMKKTWLKIFPETPFDYLKVKETYYKNYDGEQRLSKIVGIFSILAVVLSLFGLFGLIIFYAESRTKEIGIRKVNGAKTIEIMAMLNKDFVKWVAISFIIACPISWYAINKWLENFAYKTELSWWVFSLAGIMVMLIALLTVSWQSWNTATRNPVESLRSE